MKQPLLITLILSLVISLGYSQSKCNIVNHYEDFISIKKSNYNGRDFITLDAVKHEYESCFSELVNANLNLIDYLLKNFSLNINQKGLLALTDSNEISRIYFQRLTNDSMFNAVMVDFANKAIDEVTPKDSVSMDKLLNTAVKFFYIPDINNDGHYMVKICIGINGLRHTESEREPFLEAFSFTSIWKHYMGGGEFSIYDEFVNNVKQLYKLNLGVEKEEQLLRAQGALFMLMRNNDLLKDMLKSEYEKQKAFLPFVLVSE